MCSRAANRVIAPDGRKLATKQIIQSWVAECAAEIQAARLMTLSTAWTIENQGTKAARYDISFIKFFVADVLQKVVDRALQVYGGMGMSDDTIIAYFFRHERAARIYDGTDEVHKMAVARRILRDYEGRAVR
jgi:alkylation response protein AidB-like acyl-CoA dehydrogenase